MVENAHEQQFDKFVALFQRLESSLIEIISAIAEKDYALEILPVETKYRRLVGAADGMFSQFVDRLRPRDPEVKTRFHELMERCLDIGALRDRFVHAEYALLTTAGSVVAPVQEKSKPGFKVGSPGSVIAQDSSIESFEPYCRQIAEALGELESFRLQVITWKRREN